MIVARVLTSPSDLTIDSRPVDRLTVVFTSNTATNRCGYLRLIFARLQICLVRIIWRHVISYLDRFGFRVITINYLDLTSIVVPNFTGIWRFRPNDLCSIWQTYRLSLGIRQGHRAAIKAVTCFYLFTVSQGDRFPSRNGVFTLISLHYIAWHRLR